MNAKLFSHPTQNAIINSRNVIDIIIEEYKITFYMNDDTTSIWDFKNITDSNYKSFSPGDVRQIFFELADDPIENLLKPIVATMLKMQQETHKGYSFEDEMINKDNCEQCGTKLMDAEKLHGRTKCFLCSPPLHS